MASPYLLRIIAKPKDEPVESWIDWYKSEGLPATLSKVHATRSSLCHTYNDFRLQTKTPLEGQATDLHEVQLSQNIDLEPPNDKVVLVLAQIGPLDGIEETFRLASPPVEGEHAAIADIRLYKLIEDYDPKKLGHRQYSHVLTILTPLEPTLTQAHQAARPSASTCRSSPPTRPTTTASTAASTCTC